MATKTLFDSLNQNKRKTAPNTYMATLNYRPGEEWEKGDVKRVTEWLKRTYGTWLLSYAWVCELHESGKLHYHLMATYAKGSMPYLDRPQGKRGFIPWAKGSTKVEKAKSIFYLSKYVGKEHQKDYDRFPRNVRAFAVWVSALYSWETRNGVRQTALPSWVASCLTKENITSGKLSVRPSRGGGWDICGTLVCSDYEYLGSARNEIEIKSLIDLWRYHTGGNETPVKGIQVSHYLEMQKHYESFGCASPE